MYTRYDDDQSSGNPLKILLIPVIGGIITFGLMMAFDDGPKVIPEAVAAKPEVIPEPEIIKTPEEPINSLECENLSVMVTPGDQNPYEYTGERELIIIPGKVNEQQAELLAYAYEVAKADGHKDPAILQGLIWQESKAGGYPGYEVAGDEYGLKFGSRYYGVGQIKVSAAKDVFKHYAEDFPGWDKKTDEEIIANLIMDKKFNIRVASKYLLHMQHNKQTNFIRPVNYAITAYNRGLGNTYGTDYNNWHYTVSVHKHKDTFIKEFNIANNID